SAAVGAGAGAGGRPGEIGSGFGPLSNVNLGSSSLALKNLIERIDLKRSEVMASDAELRNLMSEVRKNRSKWASEDKIGQEELYEPAEKVLNMLKAETSHSAPFLTRVNKRDAPDYYTVITHPMDLGSMTKKLKNMTYKSKAEFVNDLNLIWSNCLSYNTNADHPLRKHALYMRKVSQQLEPMIPDVTVRDRAEVEAEERRLQMADLDGGEESDDEPIMTSRGRPAGGKGARKGKGLGARATTSASAKTKPATAAAAAAAAAADDASQSTPGVDGGVRLDATSGQQASSAAPAGSDLQSDAQGSPPLEASQLHDGMDGLELENDGPNALAAAAEFSRPIIDFDNPEYKMWKQVTQKGRAEMTKERHRLFKGGKLNGEEPALLRTQAGMRRWLRGKVTGVEELSAMAPGGTSPAGSAADNGPSRPAATASLAHNAQSPTGETLAENMDQEVDHVVPDYYDVMSAMPDIPEQLRWVEDSEGNAIDMCEEYLRMLPPAVFLQPPSKFAKKLDANMRQMQESRKVCSKIVMVRQMQQQTQTYQNQFQSYNLQPFVEKDVPPHVLNHAGPVISPWTARAALQRSLAKVFYSVGFEEFQPSALDAATGIAEDFFQRLSGTLKEHMQAPLVPADDGTAPVKTQSEDVPSMTTTPPAALSSTRPTAADTSQGGTGKVVLRRPRTAEQMVLLTLNAAGLDPELLEAYVKDDIDRTSTKLVQLHERLRTHYKDLVRPAIQDAAGDGSALFQDGSEQFIGGDFAEDIDEDFFGFKALGLVEELGLDSLSVPLHLFQKRIYTAHQSESIAEEDEMAVFAPPPKYPPITMENVGKQIGLVQKFLLAKLKKAGDKPLVEDLDLPPKQRPNPIRARLPATGKIPPMVITPAKPTKKEASANSAKRPAPATSKKDAASPIKKKTKKAAPAPAGGAGGGSGAKEKADAGKKG
ncbi:Transcriptional activator spt7, partial [Ascosphaera acerosa]